MNRKTYSLAINLKDGSVVDLSYGYEKSYRKWAYRAKNVPTMIVACHGVEQGTKVANTIAGSIRRCGTIDGLCRSNIDRIVGVVE